MKYMNFVDNHIKNIGYGIASFLVIFWIFKFAGVAVDAGLWLVTILLLLVYFELWDLSKKK